MLQGIESADSGKIQTGETIVFGYYSQTGLELKEDKRVIEIVKDFADVIQLSNGSKVNASQFLQLFQFPTEMQFNYYSKLSGGEKRRLHLLTVLIRNPNFLILDEPTNDLDLLTLNILEDFLFHYKGCLVVVSHDRYFMDKLVDHLFIFAGDGNIQDYNGRYSQYRLELEDLERSEAKKKNGKSNSQKQDEENKPSAKKKFTYKEKLEFEKLELEISKLEEEKSLLEIKLNNGTDYMEANNLAKRIQELKEDIDKRSLRWMELSELIL